MWRTNSEASPYRHIAMWPRALVRQMLLPTTREGDTVLDPFLGTGTTIAAAMQTGRNSVGYEVQPEYIALARRRLGQASLEYDVSFVEDSADPTPLTAPLIDQ